MSNFVLLHVDIQSSQHHLLEDYNFPIVYYWHIAQNFVDSMNCTVFPMSAPTAVKVKDVI